MLLKKNILQFAGATGALLALAVPAHAGSSASVSMSFSPASLASVAVPTLGEGALLALALLLIVVAVRALRDRSSSGTAASVVALGGLLGGLALVGALTMERSVATSSFSASGATSGSCEAGGVQEGIIPRVGNIFTNDCPNDLTIDSITVTSGECLLVESNEYPEPSCEEGSTVPGEGGACEIPVCAEF
jgi:hypothetical protein